LTQINGTAYVLSLRVTWRDRELGIPIQSIGIRGIRAQLTSLFQGQVANGQFETRRLIVKTDPLQLLDKTRPVPWQWLCLASNLI
jgi:hypothetical protein